VIAQTALDSGGASVRCRTQGLGLSLAPPGLGSVRQRTDANRRCAHRPRREARARWTARVTSRRSH